MTTVVVSPHMDDAVLSYGATMAGIEDCWVLTVLAGYPPAWTWPTPFDNASGFSDSIEAVRARRQEDRDACRAVGARWRHLDFLDGQYGLPPDEDLIVEALADQFAIVNDVVVPLGLSHPDHRMIARCCRRALAGRPCTIYADLPAAKLVPSHVPGALRGWERAGWRLCAREQRGNWSVKRRAVDCYQSQLRFEELAWKNLLEERAWIARSE